MYSIIHRLRLFYELSKRDAWWDGLTHQEQKAYLRKNPHLDATKNTTGIYRVNKLSPTNLKKIDSWNKYGPGTSFSDKIFGGPKHINNRLTVPLESHNKIDVPDDIKNHLEGHGYKIEDYKKGIAKDHHDRSINIGKALNRTKADPELINKFSNDPQRNNSNLKDLRVTISRKPEDVASMSTNKGWTSCMNMNDGLYKKYLPHDIAQGTHVAYLHHKDDHDILNPIARIALKPYEGQETGHRILRAEDKTYGSDDNSFSHTVNKWTEHHFPMQDSVYKKNTKLYSDSPVMKNTIINSDATDEQLTSLLNKRGYSNANTRLQAIQHPNIKEHHITQVMNKKGSSYNSLKCLALNNIHANEKHIMQGLKEKSHGVKTAAILNPRVNEHHLTHAQGDSYNCLRNIVAGHEKATKKHIEAALKDPDPIVRKAVLTNKHLDANHIDHFLDHDCNDNREKAIRTAIRRNIFTPGHTKKALNDVDPKVRTSAIINNPIITKDQLHEALQDPDVHVRRAAIANKNIDKSHVEAALKDPDPIVKRFAGARK